MFLELMVPVICMTWWLIVASLAITEVICGVADNGNWYLTLLMSKWYERREAAATDKEFQLVRDWVALNPRTHVEDRFDVFVYPNSSGQLAHFFNARTLKCQTCGLSMQENELRDASVRHICATRYFS